MPTAPEEFLVVSTSLNPASRSRLLARAAHAAISALRPGRAGLIDLLDLSPPLPLCDGAAAYEHPDVERLAARIRTARGILLAIGVYNYSASASAKNLIELTDKAWTGRLVGFLAAAGGQNSYMAPMSLASSLMLDFRCYVVPRYVYAPSDAFQNDTVADASVRERISTLCEELVRVGDALHAAAR